MKRTVFFISDGTGITAETMGKSLLSHFEILSFAYKTIPYLTAAMADEVKARIVTESFAAGSCSGAQ